MATTTISNPGTERQDNWWLEPLLIFSGLSAFIIYASVRGIMGFMDFPFIEYNGDRTFLENHSEYLASLGYLYHGGGAHYVSPLASPDLSLVMAPIINLFIEPLRNWTGWQWLAISPALWILWAPGGFRVTCYYYRKAYYRSFFASPPACAVAPDKKNPLAWLLGFGDKYRGERVFPLIMQNLHRYFFYIAALFMVILGIDALMGFFFETGTYQAVVKGETVTRHIYDVGVRFGTIVLVLNFTLLALYTFSCHSWRHLLGGMVDNYSACGAVGNFRLEGWKRQSKLNEHHMLFAWLSLFWVGFTDFYIWMISRNIWEDIVLIPNLGLQLRFPFL